MTRDEFRKRIEDSGCTDVAIELQSPSENSRFLTEDNFEFFDALRRYLITAVSSAIGKYSGIGEVFDDAGDDTVAVGLALDEKVIFLGKFLLWSSGFIYNVTGYELDFHPATDDEKSPDPSANSVSMVDVTGSAAIIFFIECYEKVKDRITDKYGEDWFNNWPEIFRIAYLLRNAFAHGGRWHIQERNDREHYQTEVFHWDRAGLDIQMRDAAGNCIDESKEVLSYLNGADLVVFLLEMSDELNS
ncbi:MAG TPA: hypothetical protein QGF41_16220 [Gammaproteobacteria bacterium]|jgi:hypothetical protein|nr:hypothetical protein [Gammaproteobacteria bacterium]|tara:strand:- start:11620 stop:12354 length:735 start_codon:yes stop_codon:yes gene_type:complete